MTRFAVVLALLSAGVAPTSAHRGPVSRVGDIAATDVFRDALGTHRRRLAACLWAGRVLPDAPTCSTIPGTSQTTYVTRVASARF